MSETTETHYCHFHPTVATELRCNRCGKYICIKDARRTPVGYRCKECVKEQQDVFFTATQADYVIAAVVTLPLSYLAAVLATSIGLFVILLGAFAGGVIAEAVWRLTGKRRGRYLWLVVIGCMLATAALRLLSVGIFSFDLVWTGIYLALAGGVVSARLRFLK